MSTSAIKSFLIVEEETRKGTVVCRVEAVRDAGANRVLWNYKDDGLGLTWRHLTLEGNDVIVGFERPNYFTHFLTMDDLLVGAGLKENSSEIKEKNRQLHIVLANQMKVKNEEREAQKQEAARIVQTRLREHDQIRAKQEQEAARRVREKKEQELAEKERENAARKREVNSRTRICFWNAVTGEPLYGTPVHNNGEMSLLITRRDRQGRNIAFAVKMAGDVPADAIIVEKSPGGQIEEHPFDFRVSFYEPATSPSSPNGSNGKSAPRELPRICLYGSDGRVHQYAFLESNQMTRPEVLGLLRRGWLVAINQRGPDNKYPMHKMLPDGALSKEPVTHLLRASKCGDSRREPSLKQVASR